MADVALRDIKTDFYHFLESHRTRLRLVNYQFSLESGQDLNRGLTWFGRNEKIEAARFYAEEGTYIDYFEYCIEESYFSLQISPYPDSPFLILP